MSHATGSTLRTTRPITIAVIAAVVTLQIAIGVIGFVLIKLLGDSLATMTVITIVTIVLNALQYAVVAGGAALIARTPTGRLLGIVLPMLAWLLNTVLWHGLVQLIQFYDPIVIGLVSPMILLLVLAGWGSAAWIGRRWLIGLPVTYVLLIVLQVPLALTPAMPSDNGFAAAYLMSALSTVVTTVAMTLGGLVCWLLARSEQVAGK
ncbi:hypothetical protein [Nocardioides albus]|uniref:Uncharacterized protein n=1 Tax=Nocardioides albus TaxID=1841 RepID=A0A7W5A3K0_9ACTN|nr:hypothetical protein [Nocardioides albus]MBB3088845.1 hypothetical protein [Nocardioides albus]GGU19091.1 hypothetical protein GCM10007979_17370 [Nocardioides albus]